MCPEMQEELKNVKQEYSLKARRYGDVVPTTRALEGKERDRETEAVCHKLTGALQILVCLIGWLIGYVCARTHVV